MPNHNPLVCQRASRAEWPKSCYTITPDTSSRLVRFLIYLVYNGGTKTENSHHFFFLRNLAQVAAVSPRSVTVEETSIHVGKLYPNLINPNEIAGGRMKIGGAIRARTVGKNVVDNVDSGSSSRSLTIPIHKAVTVGADRIIF